MSIPQAQIVEVFDRSAETYEQVGPAFFGPIGAGLATRAGISPGARVLDLGCGRGHVLFPAAELAGPAGHVVGTDLAPRMVEATRAEAARRGLTQVEVLLGDAGAPDFPPGSFDVVLAGLVLFFLSDPAAAVQAYARLLRLGGRLAITTFGAQDPVYEEAMKAIAAFGAQTSGYQRHQVHNRLRAPESVTDLLAGNGFGEVSMDEATYETRFESPEQWWEWVWSHGGRATLEKVPADRTAEAQAQAFAIMERTRTPEGDLAIHTTARYTTASMPA